MKPVSTRVAGLLLTLVGLTALILLEWQAGAPKVAPTSSPGMATEPAALPVPVAHDDDDPTALLQTILDRPLFSPGRRPDASPTGTDPGLVRLAGVIVTPRGRSAIFAGRDGRPPVAVHPGERIGRYVVSSIDGNAVTVDGPDGRHVLHPAFDPAAPVPVALPAPVRQGGAK